MGRAPDHADGVLVNRAPIQSEIQPHPSERLANGTVLAEVASVTLSFEGVCFNLGGSSSNCVFAELLQ
jgi:hypothetical protein